MIINRSLGCRRRQIAVVLLVVLMLPLFGCGSRIFAEQRQARRTARDNDNIAVPPCSSKTNSYTVRSKRNASPASSWSGVDDSDRLVPTGPNRLHHRHH